MDFKKFAENCPWCFGAWTNKPKCKAVVNGGLIAECNEENCGLLYAIDSVRIPISQPIKYEPIKQGEIK